MTVRFLDRTSRSGIECTWKLDDGTQTRTGAVKTLPLDCTHGVVVLQTSE